MRKTFSISSIVADLKQINACSFRLKATTRLTLPLLPSTGFSDLCEQCANRRTEWNTGVQTSVRVGEVELPREHTPIIHTQRPAKR